jgi:hypothetical protein
MTSLDTIRSSRSRRPACGRARRGYALVLVLVFMVLLVSLTSMAYRQVASALRIESVRALQTIRDEGSLQAAAQALALLQTGLPPSSPYLCGATIETPTGQRVYEVTFTSPDNINWTIHAVLAADGEALDPMPNSFAAP